ncbi:amiloride-sensitive amine oxidase [copper-containing]-like [Hydractinia symbiolongicarpus]|uniref:amiloride-sensitive amine oxidase [copper-containing]-like n=1 Tax=Hydractinia symbiolongicarpus TaxID=13093 RepID=UPI0025515F3B|nr:amiloride-sensitive amine oxidase [copper-containing]-like [Hydractinia symbiolongicarpus]
MNGAETENFQVEEKVASKNRSNIHKTINVVLIVIIVIVLIAFVAYAITKDKKCECMERDKKRASKNEFTCKDKTIKIEPHANDENDIFRELNLKEINTVVGYIERNFVIRRMQDGHSIQMVQFINTVELYLPNKKEALEYLDNNGPKPRREAIVSLQTSYNVSYYVVGSLPTPNHHYLAKFADRQNPSETKPDEAILNNNPTIKKLGFDHASIMWPLFKATFETLKGYATAEIGFENGLSIALSGATEQRKNEFFGDLLFQFNLQFPPHLQFLDVITFRLNLTSKDENKWRVIQIFYNQKAYSSAEEIMQRYNRGELHIKKIKRIPDVVLQRANLKRRGSQLNYFPSIEPLTFYPNGPRFSIQGRKITYFDWQFNYMVQASTGPAIFDVRFKNQRIAFEISLQEASSLYATGSPRIYFSNILDSTWSLGKSHSLIKGVDCPQNAAYMDVSLHLYASKKAVTVENAVCVFENNANIPLRRHHHGAEHFEYGGLTDSFLVVRFITDMSSYDYIHDFVFHQNGVVEIKTTTTGHLVLSQSYKQFFNQYGYEVVDGYIGAIHDHFMLYKVDLDILGTKNSFKTLDMTLEKTQTIYDYHPTVKKFIKENKIKTEKEAAISYNFDHPKYYIIYNENEKNIYGNHRGYRIYSPNKIKQVYPDEHRGTKHTEWSKYQITVSKFKETERFGSCMFNYFPQYGTPRCSFDARIEDNETIVNEDLVAWIPIGGLHIPCAEDYPTTPTTGNQFTFFIKPFNYFDEDPSFASANSVYVEHKNETFKIDTYGTPTQATCPILSSRLLG